MKSSAEVVVCGAGISPASILTALPLAHCDVSATMAAFEAAGDRWQL